MSTTPEPVHLNNHHRDTLTQILQHPVGHNIEWRAVLSLLGAVGSVTELADGKYLAAVGGETETLMPPRDFKELCHRDVVRIGATRAYEAPEPSLAKAASHACFVNLRSDAAGPNS